MDKWADYLISEVSYDSNRLITTARRHKDEDKGITDGVEVDRMSIISDMKNKLSHLTIYSGNNTWKKGYKIKIISVEGDHYLRIDENIAKLDYLGDIPEVSISKSGFKQTELQSESISEEEYVSEQIARLEQLEKQIQDLELQDLELQSESISEPKYSKGSLPKESSEELPQELELVPESISEEEYVSEQIARLEQLEKQIMKLLEKINFEEI